MGKYSWSLDEHAEYWDNTEDTIQHCLLSAQEENDDGDRGYKSVYIGKNVAFVPDVYSESILERLQESAEYFGFDWCAYDYNKNDELNELSKSLTEVTHKWLRKYGYYPDFYTIENVQEYSLEEVVSESGDSDNLNWLDGI